MIQFYTPPTLNAVDHGLNASVSGHNLSNDDAISPAKSIADFQSRAPFSFLTGSAAFCKRDVSVDDMMSREKTDKKDDVKSDCNVPAPCAAGPKKHAARTFFE